MTSFSQVHKYLLQLLLLYVLLLLCGYLYVSLVNPGISFREIIILSTLFSIIAFISLVIFLRGQTREPDSQTLHSLTSVSLKFLMEIILALVWFIVAKKTSIASVLMFFVLYLSHTLFLLWVILKTLKNKSL
jgi:hypothetical protein